MAYFFQLSTIKIILIFCNTTKVCDSWQFMIEYAFQLKSFLLRAGEEVIEVCESDVLVGDRLVQKLFAVLPICPDALKMKISEKKH